MFIGGVQSGSKTGGMCKLEGGRGRGITKVVRTGKKIRKIPQAEAIKERASTWSKRYRNRNVQPPPPLPHSLCTIPWDPSPTPFVPSPGICASVTGDQRKTLWRKHKHKHKKVKSFPFLQLTRSALVKNNSVFPSKSYNKVLPRKDLPLA